MASAVARLPIAGPLIALVALLAIWRDNMMRLPIESVWPTAAIVVTLAGLVVVPLRALMGSWARAGLGGAIVAAYVFYAPPLVGLLGLPRWAVLLTHLALIVLLTLAAKRIPRDGERAGVLAARINAIVVVILLVTLVPLVIDQVKAERTRAAAQHAFVPLEGSATAGSPDVWHIIFDRYAGADTLRSTYAFDNAPFIAGLRQRGFVVQDQAFSNYQRTGHSVASTLNGALLDALASRMANGQDDWIPIYRTMRDSAALNLFNRMGYRTIFAGSWWEPTRFSSTADESIQLRPMPQLARLLIDKSAIGLWTQGVSLPYLDGRGDQCFRANEKFRLLRRLAGSSGDRKLVIAHFLVPHPPYVLDADGGCKSLTRSIRASRRDNYVGQVEFANREALALIDAILAGPHPAVIVIHGDEGPWPAPYVGDEHGLGTDTVPVAWNKLPPKKLREKMSTLLAVRGPGGPPRTMPASPVQIYPAILLDYFGSSRPLPPSRHYVFRGKKSLYHFEDVTDMITRQAPVRSRQR